MNASFFLGVLRGLLLGAIIGFPAGYPFARILPPNFTVAVQCLIALTVAALYVLWVYHITPTKNKTAVRFAGSKRWRAGPRGNGLKEGLNAMWLGWPLCYPEDKPILEITHTFEQMQAYSKDRIGVKLDGTINIFIDDVYQTYNISDEDAVKAVVSTVLKCIRAKVEDFTAEELISQEAGTSSAKVILANLAYNNAFAELSGPHAPWGRNITEALQINHIEPTTEFADTLRQREEQKVRGEYQSTQLNQRLEQLDKTKARGVSPDLAAAFVQVEADKAGAKINTLNIPGLHGIGHGVSHAAESLNRYLFPETETDGGP